MPKVLLSLVATAVGLVLLLTYRTSMQTSAATGGGNTMAQSPAGTPSGTQSNAVQGGPPPAGTTPSSPAMTGKKPTSSAAAAPPANTGTKTVVGPVEQNDYGPVQVKVTLTNGKITDVTALKYPTSSGRSVSISNRALPLLRSEALTAQSAKIDAVSGASYTSASYKQSLQAALTQAGHA